MFGNGDGGGGGGGGDDIKEVTHRAAGGLLTSGKKQPGQLYNLKIGQLDNLKQSWVSLKTKVKTIIDRR